MEKTNLLKEAKKELFKAEFSLLVARYNLACLTEQDEDNQYKNRYSAFRYKINIGNVINSISTASPSGIRVRNVFCIYYGYIDGYYNKKVSSKFRSFTDLAKNVKEEIGYSISSQSAENLFNKAWDDIYEAYSGFESLIDQWTLETA